MLLNSIVQEIERLKKELNGLMPLSEDQDRILRRKFRLEFNYNSNHIEGNTLTYSETELLLIFDETRGNHPLRDYEEMKASDVALELVEQLAKGNDAPLSESFIKNLNKVLLVRPYWKEAITATGEPTRREISIGEYKKHPNSVRLNNGEIFYYSSPLETPMQMAELVDWFREQIAKKELHPIEIASQLHYRFVRIHPFDDGNGRISRLLMNYTLTLFGFPIIVIKSEDKPSYLSALHDADAGNLEAFTIYLGNQLVWSLNLNLKAARNENIEEEKDWKKKLVILKKQLEENETIRELKSANVITSLINSKMKDLIGSLDSNFTEFNDLFIDKKYFLVTRQGSYDIRNFVAGPENVKANFWDDCKVKIRFIGFNKYPITPFDIEISLNFYFYNHDYSLMINEYAGLRKLYHQDYTQEDIENIRNILGKILILGIEEHLSK